MALMRRLLVDAQAKFRKMMSDNKALASRIDQDIENAHRQVSALRAELAQTNRRLNDICDTTWIEMAGNVITTCMPPTATTNTVSGSTTDGQWSNDGRHGPDTSSKKDGTMPLAAGKAEGRPTAVITCQRQSGKNHSDPGIRMGKLDSPRIALTASSRSQPCSRQSSKERSSAMLRFREGRQAGPSKVSDSVPPAHEMPSEITTADKCGLYQERSRVSGTKDGTDISSKTRSDVGQIVSPSKKVIDAQKQYGSSRDGVTVIEVDGSVQVREQEKASPSPKRDVAKLDQEDQQQHDEVTTVITKDSQSDQIKYKQKECQSSRLDKPGSSYSRENNLDRVGPYQHTSNNSWCSDTGDSVSDILTSDECIRDQNEIPEADRLATGPTKTFESEFRSQGIAASYRSSFQYSSFKSKHQEGQDHRSTESENDSLRIKCSALQRDLEEVMESRDEKAKENALLAAKLERLENEVKHAKESLSTLKQDRKRLKAEKFDLLTQMKQLYSTLEDKEAELREFIRNYEQKMKDSDETLKQLRREREELEKEKWTIMQRARDEAERCVLLCTQLGLKDSHIKEMQEELTILREKQLSTDQSIRQANGYGSPGSVSYRTVNGLDSRGTPTPTPGSDPTTSSSYAGTPTITVQYSNTKDAAKASSPSQDDHDRRPLLLSRSAEDIFNTDPVEEERQKIMSKKLTKEKKGSTWGSISRVFSRNKQRRKALDPDLFQNRTSWSPKGSVCSSSPLSEESYHQKLRLLEETHGTPTQHWRAATVLAWLEITMDMPQYGTMCAENIKSGKVLLELSDAELEEGLGISNVMHRRKLRLAIEEHREPSLCHYPKICLMTHSWVVEEWLSSIAMTCYLPSFSEHLVDGRVLDTLTKKDLEKHFGITRKFHQMSIIHGIQLLRMLSFDRQILNQRRQNSENMDVDPLVWTNQRFIKWAASIDLGEYAENLRNSGVHGALAVLETSFTAETMATALGIPTSKNIIRRHLTTEWQNLIQPARLSLESESVVAKKSRSEKRLVSGSSSTSLASQGGRGSSNLVQSYARRTLDRYDRRRTSWRFSTWRSSQESLKSTSSKKTVAAQPTPTIERPRLLPLSPKLNSSRHRRTFSSHSDVETLTVTPV